MNKTHYVYVLFRENGQPFYVGMGKGDRWRSHEKHCSDDSHKSRIIKKFKRAGMVVPKIKLAENLTRAEAWGLECVMIQLIGREPNGPLINQTAGGEGGLDPSPELIQKNSTRMKEFMSRPENRAVISMANKGRLWSSETRAIVSKQTAERNKGNTYALGRTCTPEHRARVSAAKKGQKYAWVPDPYLFWYSSHVESSPALSDAVGLH